MKTRLSTLSLFILTLLATTFLWHTNTPTALALNDSSLNLDGTGDYILIENAPELNPTAGITVEAWVWRDNSDRCETIMGKHFTTGFWLGFCSGPIRFYTNGTGTSVDGTFTVQPNRWTHVAVTFDGTTRTYYIDGMIDYVEVTPGTFPVNAADLAIGADHNGNFAFSGDLAEVRLWGTARTQEDIRADMVHRITDERPGLIAVWPLDGNASEVFSNFDGDPQGDAQFNGTAAPVFPDGPIQIPRIPTPTINGICASGEYDDVRLPIWYSDNWSALGLSWANVGATADDLYICLDQLPQGSDPNQFAAVYIDPDDDGDAFAQSDDYRFRMTWPGRVDSAQQGNGAGGWTSTALSNFEAQGPIGAEFFFSAEYRIDRSTIFTGTDAIFGMQFTHEFVTSPSDNYGWPLDYDTRSPEHWPSFQINDADLPRSDSANPTVFTSRMPTEPQEGETVIIRAEPRDDVDVSRVEIYVDNVLAQTCSYDGVNDTFPAPCLLSQTYPLGRHTYYAFVIDHRGRRGGSSLAQFFVRADGEQPTVSASFTPQNPANGAPVTIEAIASDPSGISQIEITLDAAPWRHVCTYTGTATTQTCNFTFSAHPSRDIIRYRAEATDRETLTNVTPRMTILYGNDGPDSDNDGISNDLEARLCTSPSDPDTDGDALVDGWELLGLHFDDGESVDLPTLGANPCQPDVFLQLDWEAGYGFTDAQKQMLIDEYLDNGIVLHITGFERPAPIGDAESTIGAVVASSMTDGSGNYYFPPKYNWTHYYGYARKLEGRSGAWGHFFTIDMLVGDRYNRLIHELGHSVGLGHGGRTGGTTPLWNDGVLYYNGEWINRNYKPNYLSVMNYQYFSVGQGCYNSTTGGWIANLSYTANSLPTLDESNLDERSTSTFSTALRAQSCDTAGFNPAFIYSCEDPDEMNGLGNPTRYIMVSDGLTTLARVRTGSAWQLTGLPSHISGIDWNCDGNISSSVTQNINGTLPEELCDGIDNDLDDEVDEGCGGSWASDSEVMTAPADWPLIMAGRQCLILRNDDGYPQTAAYRALIDGPDCADLALADAPQFAMGPASVNGVSHDDDHEHGPLDPTDHDDEQLFPILPNLEFCDGENNDGDNEIDEGCVDTDSDTIIDNIDNCPLTPNSDQIDLDSNGLGDVCQYPAATSLIFDGSTSGTVQLNWDVDLDDYLGFNVYRRSFSEEAFTFIGSSYPSTTTTSYTDAANAADGYIYEVRPVNLRGEEGNAVTITTGNTIFLPFITLP